MATNAPQPPAGLYPGAVDLGDGRVTFALYAPGKRCVSLIGDFNHWDRHADPLNVTEAGLWWLEKHLNPGSYTYQFAVDVDSPEGEIVICDPYARVLAEGAEYDPPRAVVLVGAPPFQWQHDGWPRPEFKDLIIYEMHVGDFSPEGTLRGVIQRLDYLAGLGINAIELMPIFEYKGDRGWGYDPAYFFTVETSYGTPTDFRELVDQAHAHGIGIILDLVLAHTAHRHPFNKLYPYDQSPWYGQGCGEPNQFGFPTLDHTKGPTRDFVRDVQAFWINEYHVDGFRYDYCAGIGCRDDIGMPYLVHSAHEQRPGAWLIAEYSPENPDDVNLCGVDGAWHVGGSYALKALLVEDGCGAFNWDDFERCTRALNPWEQGYRSSFQMVNYLESHDEQRVMNDLAGSGFDAEAAARRAALGAVILFTMPGEPMLYHGEEWGEGTPRITNERNTLHWEAIKQPLGKGLLERHRLLARLRHDHPALRGDTFSLDANYPEQKTVVYHRWNDEGDEVLVAANFSPQPQQVAIPFPHGGRWTDQLTGQSLDVQGHPTVELGADTAAIYVAG